MTDALTQATRAARAAWFRHHGDEASAEFVDRGDDDGSSTFTIVRDVIAFDRANDFEAGEQLTKIIAAALIFDRRVGRS